jgi:putative addiction module component (TIGR02574 family)
MNTKEIIEDVVSLPVEERALIVDSILRSLNHPESEIDKKWGAVAQRRLVEIKSGKVKQISGDQVFEEIWNKYNK